MRDGHFGGTGLTSLAQPGRSAPHARAAGLGALGLLVVLAGCKAQAPATTTKPKPAILLVTLDTTRADAIGPEARGVETPSFDALAARGLRFRQAYATVPETLPSHASIMTGLYPAGHGIHENARYLPADRPVLAERLRQAGYRTAAFVSSFVLAHRFGLARGFDRYDDALEGAAVERPARETTDRAVAWLRQEERRPLFVWVHYYDPHHPYSPPEPYKSRYPKSPYLGEVAAMDEQLGRLVAEFERHAGGPSAIVVVGDHGEGLGEHGEAQHGNLLYQSTMHVPLLLVGPGIAAGTSELPVSTRCVFDTVLDWAGLDSARSLRRPAREIVLGEAMKPFLSYGWQPQVMAVQGRNKAILAGRVELYDVVADPAESHDLEPGAEPSRASRTALRDYPVPSPAAQRPPHDLDEQERRKLASLGYVSAGAAPAVRKDAPRPADMSRLFERLDTASSLFVRQEYAKLIPVLDSVLAEDPGNLDATLRLATAHSMLGHEKPALAAFARAAAIVPGSQDVSTYLALHYLRARQWQKAAPLLEQVVAEAPDRLPAVEALARVRELQGRPDEALELLEQVYRARTPSAPELVHLGQLAMSLERTPLAIDAFEKARAVQADAFGHDLELGVLYLAARRLEDARQALDRVPASSRDYPMALFKRAQVSVLLGEPDRAARIEAARRHADATTRGLIEKERLFRTGT